MFSSYLKENTVRVLQKLLQKFNATHSFTLCKANMYKDGQSAKFIKIILRGNSRI